MAAEWVQLPKTLEWIASHSKRLTRKDYQAPNHLANGHIRFKQSGDWQTVTLDYEGNPTAKLMVESGPLRVEIYGGSNELLFAEDTVLALAG